MNLDKTGERGDGDKKIARGQRYLEGKRSGWSLRLNEYGRIESEKCQPKSVDERRRMNASQVGCVGSSRHEEQVFETQTSGIL